MKYFILYFLIFCFITGKVNSKNNSKVNLLFIEYKGYTPPDSIFYKNFLDSCFCIEYEDVGFQGGDKSNFIKYLTDRLDSIKTKFTCQNFSSFIIQFDIDRKGYVTNIDLIKNAEFDDYNLKLLDLVKNSPKWTPAKILGNSIKTKITIEILFIDKKKIMTKIY